MSKNLNNLQKQAISREEAKIRNLITIHLDTPIRILENDTQEELVINGKTYTTGSVDRGDIETGTDGALEKVDISISNVDRSILSLIINQGDVLTGAKCTVEAVIFDNETNEILGDVELFTGKIGRIDVDVLELRLTVERLVAGALAQIPYATYDVNCQCRTFKDERCGYVGNETKCDKTLTRCKELGNSLYFFGFPSIPKAMVVKV